jgi:hypothetical protein
MVVVPSTLTSKLIKLPDTADDCEYCFQKGWSDGLPVVPPTPARVGTMLLGTARDPSEVLGKMPPNYNVLNVEKAAVAAVMAGCEPRQFHVALAALECALDPACAYTVYMPRPWALLRASLSLGQLGMMPA